MQSLGTCGQQEAVGSRKLWVADFWRTSRVEWAKPWGCRAAPLWEGQGGREGWGLDLTSLREGVTSLGTSFTALQDGHCTPRPV